MSETVTSQAIQAAARELLSTTQRNGLIKTGEVTCPAGWKPLPKEYYSAYRVKATNLDMGLFAKIFAPDGQLYATALYQAYVELAGLNLKIPILKPTELASSVLFFPLGQPKRQAPLMQCITPEQLSQTSEIIIRHGLIPIKPQGGVAIIEVAGKEYLADVVEDTDPNVDRFLDSLPPTT